jgi:phospholipid/cholesterol/gamma-HCH transport system permease protein
VCSIGDYNGIVTFLPGETAVVLKIAPGSTMKVLSGSKAVFSGLITIEGLRDLSRTFAELKAADEVDLDFGQCRGFDGVVAARIWNEIRSLEKRGVKVRVDGLSPEYLKLLTDYTNLDSRELQEAKDDWLPRQFSDIGEKVAQGIESAGGLVKFSVNSTFSILDALIRPHKIRWTLVAYYMEQAGVMAIPIIVALQILLGFILGYQAGIQMGTLGAAQFMPRILAYSIFWEIGPMLTAVLVAGRSGSAFAAEIGTMKVRQEVDALEVMGFNLCGYIVAPKVLALYAVMPFLVLLSNFSGLFGALLAGEMFLDIPARVFVQEVRSALIPLDVYWGMIKALFYAGIIAITGCFMGIRVRGGAAAVGRATTSAVVSGIFQVILADALLSLVLAEIRPPVI